MYNVMNEISRWWWIVSENKYTKYEIMIPPSSLLKPAPTDLYTEIEERIPNKILQILRISWISQYTEVKSENTPKKSEDLQGFHRYTLKYLQNMNCTMYIPVTYCRKTNFQK